MVKAICQWRRLYFWHVVFIYFFIYAFYLLTNVDTKCSPITFCKLFFFFFGGVEMLEQNKVY